MGSVLDTDLHVSADDDVLWLKRVERMPRKGFSFRPILLCAVGTVALTAAILAGGYPPGVPHAEASASASLPLQATGDASAIRLAVEPPAVEAAVTLASVTNDIASTGLSGAAAASIAQDPAAAMLDKVSPETMRNAVEAAGPADPDEILSFGPMRIRRWIVGTILRAARETGSDPVLLMAIADKESSFITAVKARTSSAEGLYQFIGRTWLKVVRDFGPTHGLAAEAALVIETADGLSVEDAAEKTRILELRRDPYLAAVLAAEMLRHDAARIGAKIGRELTHGEIYIAHFLGPDDAETFLEKVVASPGAVAAKLLPRPARANRPIFYTAGRRKAKGLSVAQVHRKFEEMMGMRAERYRGVGSTVPALAYASAEIKTP